MQDLEQKSLRLHPQVPLSGQMIMVMVMVMVWLNVIIEETVRRAKNVLITIVPFHQVIICVIYFSIWHSLTKINKLCSLLRTVTNRYLWNSGGSCKKDLDCGIKGKCSVHTCYQSCEYNNHCTYEDHCVNNICLPKISTTSTNPAGKISSDPLKL